MPAITLTTDLGYRDPYLGRVKAKIFELTKGRIPVFDISNEVSPFNLQEAAFVVQSAFRDFPRNSVHLLGIDAQSSPEQPHIAMSFEQHFFVGADNGLFSLIIGDRPFDKIVRIVQPKLVEGTFPEREVLAPVACHLASGGSIDRLGEPLDFPREMVGVRPQISRDGGRIQGHVIYIDRLGNVLTNIHREEFEVFRGDRAYEIRIRNQQVKFVDDSYHGRINFALPPGERKGAGTLTALFNSNGLLEICMYKSDLQTVGGASNLLGLEYRDTITIEFT